MNRKRRQEQYGRTIRPEYDILIFILIPISNSFQHIPHISMHDSQYKHCLFPFELFSFTF